MKKRSYILTWSTFARSEYAWQTFYLKWEAISPGTLALVLGFYDLKTRKIK